MPLETMRVSGVKNVDFFEDFAYALNDWALEGLFSFQFIPFVSVQIQDQEWFEI